MSKFFIMDRTQPLTLDKFEASLRAAQEDMALKCYKCGKPMFMSAVCLDCNIPEAPQ